MFLRPVCPISLHARLRLRSALFAFLLVGAMSCGELPEPELGSPPTSIANSLDLQAPVVGSARTPSNGDANALSDGEVADLILTTGMVIGTGPASRVSTLGPPFTTISPILAVDDRLGGIVAQAASGEVLWFPGEGGSSQLINVEGGQLLDVGLRADTPSAFLLVEELASGDSAEGTDDQQPSPTQRIDVVELVTGERQPFAVLEAGRILSDFTAGGGRAALIYTDDECGGLLLFDDAGVPIETSLPASQCPVVGRPFHGAVALSPDGGLLVHTEVTYRPDGVQAATAIVGHDLGAGDEVFRLDVGGPGDRLSSLAFDGQRVAFIRTSLNPEVESGPIVIDLADPEDALVVSMSDAVSIAFARSPLSAG